MNVLKTHYTLKIDYIDANVSPIAASTLRQCKKLKLPPSVHPIENVCSPADV